MKKKHTHTIVDSLKKPFVTINWMKLEQVTMNRSPEDPNTEGTKSNTSCSLLLKKQHNIEN